MDLTIADVLKDAFNELLPISINLSIQSKTNSKYRKTRKIKPEYLIYFIEI